MHSPPQARQQLCAFITAYAASLSLLLIRAWLLCHVVRQTTPSLSVHKTAMSERRRCSN